MAKRLDPDLLGGDTVPNPASEAELLMREGPVWGETADEGWITFQIERQAARFAKLAGELTTGTADERWAAFQRQARRGELQ